MGRSQMAASIQQVLCPNNNTAINKKKTKNLHAGSAMFDFIIRPHNLIITQSRRAEFQCSVHSTQKPNFMWNFTRIGSSEAEIIVNSSGPLSAEYFIVAGQRSQALVVSKVQWKHVGVYKCIVSLDNHHLAAEGSLNVSSKCMHVIKQ